MPSLNDPMMPDDAWKGVAALVVLILFICWHNRSGRTRVKRMPRYKAMDGTCPLCRQITRAFERHPYGYHMLCDNKECENHGMIGSMDYSGRTSIWESEVELQNPGEMILVWVMAALTFYVVIFGAIHLTKFAISLIPPR